MYTGYIYRLYIHADTGRLYIQAVHTGHIHSRLYIQAIYTAGYFRRLYIQAVYRDRFAKSGGHPSFGIDACMVRVDESVTRAKASVCRSGGAVHV